MLLHSTGNIAVDRDIARDNSCRMCFAFRSVDCISDPVCLGRLVAWYIVSLSLLLWALSFTVFSCNDVDDGSLVPIAFRRLSSRKSPESPICRLPVNRRRRDIRDTMETLPRLAPMNGRAQASVQTREPQHSLNSFRNVRWSDRPIANPRRCQNVHRHLALNLDKRHEPRYFPAHRNHIRHRDVFCKEER